MNGRQSALPSASAKMHSRSTSCTNPTITSSGTTIVAHAHASWHRRAHIRCVPSPTGSAGGGSRPKRAHIRAGTPSPRSAPALRRSGDADDLVRDAYSEVVLPLRHVNDPQEADGQGGFGRRLVSGCQAVSPPVVGGRVVRRRPGRGVWPLVFACAQACPRRRLSRVGNGRRRVPPPVASAISSPSQSRGLLAVGEPNRGETLAGASVPRPADSLSNPSAGASAPRPVVLLRDPGPGASAPRPADLLSDPSLSRPGRRCSQRSDSQFDSDPSR